MILSIVKCSYYHKNSETMSLRSQEKISDDVEIIGPIVGPNIAAMRNYGAEQAQGEWVLFVDHDCEYSKEKVLRVLSEIKNIKNIGAFSGVYKQDTKSLIQKSYGRIQRLWVLKGLEKKPNRFFRKGNHLLGGCLVVKKQAWSEIKGFDEEIGWGGEETDFVRRLQEFGYQTGVTYNLRVLHKCNIGLCGFIKRAWVQNFNRGFYKIKLLKKSHDFKSNKISILPYKFSDPMMFSLFASISLVGFGAGTLISLLKS